MQLPLYNEPGVAVRILSAAAALRWAPGALQIQVLDDSSDETTALVEHEVQRLRALGTDIALVRRPDRKGFKAGALAYGLDSTDADFVAIFDADFVPPPDFLMRVMGEFDAADVGVVQARWEHLNPRQNLLTRAQALLLDGHFAVEQPARAALGAFFNFNGTAGVWRRRAIEEAGGWEGDTLTEDLDLSYRAQLAGWRFVFRSDVCAPAELPGEIGGFRSQQHRWAKGSVECLRKLGRRVLHAPIPARTRVEAMVHLTANFCYVLMVVIAVLLPVVALLRTTRPIAVLTWVDVVLFAVGSLSLAGFYLEAARRAGRSLPAAFATLPLAITLDVGIALHKASAVLEALQGQRSSFVRTPKSGHTDHEQIRRRSRVSSTQGGGPELALAAWNIWAIVAVVSSERPAWTALPFLLLFAVAFGSVGVPTLAAALRRRRPADAA